MPRGLGRTCRIRSPRFEVRGLRHSVQGMRIRRVAGVVRVVRAALLPVEADRCRIDWSVDGERQQRRAAM